MSAVQRWTPVDGPPAIGKYAQLSSPRAGTRMVFISGQVGNDASGALLPGVGAQTRQALANVHALAASVGAGPQDFVRLLTFLVDVANLPDYYAARDEVYTGWFPEQDYCGHSLAVVAALAQPGVLIEVEGWVAVPEQSLQEPSTAPGRAQEQGEVSDQPDTDGPG